VRDLGVASGRCQDFLIPVTALAAASLPFDSAALRIGGKLFMGAGRTVDPPTLWPAAYSNASGRLNETETQMVWFDTLKKRQLVRTL
jgi:hypothetical protein